MAEEVSTSFWISFFVEAGIPPAASANYAIIFTDNRIQKHMLLDLNKEYLKDMGVNVLGDIIAILKHAKLYHEKVAREKVLADKGPTTVQTSVQKATKHLNELLLKEEPVKPVVTAPKPAVAPARAVLKPSPPKKLKVVKSDIEIVEKEEDSPDEELEELKRKVIPPLKQPQHAKKIAVVSTQSSSKKTSVFERLGDSSVTSTTPEAPDSSAASTKSSVFQRLGDKSLKASEAQEVKTPVKAKTSAVIQPVQKLAKTVTKVPEGGLRMDMEEAASKQSAKERLALRIGSEKSKDIKRFIDNKTNVTIAAGGGVQAPLQRTVRPPTVISHQLKSKTVSLKPKSAVSLKQVAPSNRAGIKQRLGSVAAVSTLSSSALAGSSVFKRLGTTRNPS